ncbi:hypothetical protein H6761_01690 [Candidatus Nomurabacteria bacterium]|nr:hypothetical protein [Candidatus Nomurabacteria bacterium]
MKNKLKIILTVIGVLALAFWVSTKMIYAHKFPVAFTKSLAKVYNLKAGELVENKQTYPIYLADYLRYYQSLNKYLESNPEAMAELDLTDLAWQKTIRDLWIKNLAQNFSLSVSDEELEAYMQETFQDEDLKELTDFAKDNYGSSLKDFKNDIVRLYLLEIKVYQQLLENYNDKEGIVKAQDAYAALEDGQDFLAVAETYSNIPQAAEEAVWLKTEDLVGIYEPILELEKNDFSKIVIVPEAYIIWRVDDLVDDDNGEKAWKVRSIIVQAKTMDQFFEQYFTIAKINKFY